MNSNIELSEKVSEYLRAAELERIGGPSPLMQEDELPDPTAPYSVGPALPSWSLTWTTATATTTSTFYRGLVIEAAEEDEKSKFLDKLRKFINNKTP